MNFCLQLRLTGSTNEATNALKSPATVGGCYYLPILTRPTLNQIGLKPFDNDFHSGRKRPNAKKFDKDFNPR
jgi:hypothetical protein